MIAISTSWNAGRHGGWADAVRELTRLGHKHVALDGEALHGDAGAAGRAAKEARGQVVALFAPEAHRVRRTCVDEAPDCAAMARCLASP